MNYRRIRNIANEIVRVYDEHDATVPQKDLIGDDNYPMDAEKADIMELLRQYDEKYNRQVNGKQKDISNVYDTLIKEFLHGEQRKGDFPWTGGEMGAHDPSTDYFFNIYPTRFGEFTLNEALQWLSVAYCDQSRPTEFTTVPQTHIYLSSCRTLIGAEEWGEGGWSEEADPEDRERWRTMAESKQDDLFPERLKHKNVDELFERWTQKLKACLESYHQPDLFDGTFLQDIINDGQGLATLTRTHSFSNMNYTRRELVTAIKRYERLSPKFEHVHLLLMNLTNLYCYNDENANGIQLFLRHWEDGGHGGKEHDAHLPALQTLNIKFGWVRSVDGGANILTYKFEPTGHDDPRLQAAVERVNKIMNKSSRSRYGKVGGVCAAIESFFVMKAKSDADVPDAPLYSYTLDDLLLALSHHKAKYCSLKNGFSIDVLCAVIYFMKHAPDPYDLPGGMLHDAQEETKEMMAHFLRADRDEVDRAQQWDGLPRDESGVLVRTWDAARMGGYKKRRKTKHRKTKRRKTKHRKTKRRKTKHRKNKRRKTKHHKNKHRKSNLHII